MRKMRMEILVKSAQIFKNANHFFKMHLYAAASIVEGLSSSSSQNTMVDTHGGSRPFWWFPMKFQIEERKLLDPNTNDDLTLVLCIKRRRTLGADKHAGLVRLPVKDLFEYYYSSDQGSSLPHKHVAFTVYSRSGNRPRGVLYLSYMFGGEEMNVASRSPSVGPCVVVAPSAPPLPEHEENIGRHHSRVSGAAPAQELRKVTIPSAPYLPEEYYS